MTDGLKNVYREAIIATIAANDRVERAVLFGSRATGTNTATSDVDIALYGDRLTLTDQARLAAALDEIPMAQSIDLVLHDSIDNLALLEHIRLHGVEWYVRRTTGGSYPATSPPGRGRDSGNYEDQLLGSLAPGWERTTLGAACQRGGGNIQTGPFGSQLHASDYRAAGIPSIMPQNLGDNRVILDGIARIEPRDASRLRRYLVHEGDIVYSRRGDVEKRALIGPREDGWLCGTGCLRVRLGENGVNPRYASYYLGHPAVREWIVRHAHGATMPNLNTSILSSCPFVIPPLFEQRAIAHILGTLDDKIELNRRMNATLEAMARALFRSWFVDFDPVRAKMEGHDTGLPKEIADLFPDRLVESELGEVPEGWPLVPLPEVIEVNPSRPLRKGMTAPYLDMANMPTRGHAPDSVIQRPFGSGMRFANGDTLVARITPCLENGKTAYVDFLRDDEIGWGSTEYIVMKPRAPLPNEFAYCLARGTRFRDFAIRNMSGTSGRQRVPATALHGLSMPFPPERVAAAFGLAAHTLFARAADALQESRSLSALRDTLLPRLVSGELRLGVHGRHTGNVSPSLPKKRVT